jgi:outer membrane protein
MIHMIKLKHQVIALVCLAAVGGRAQETQGNSFSLQQAIEYALKYSPTHLTAVLEEQSADHRRMEITGIGLPQINASFDVKNYLAIPVMAVPLNAFNPMAPADSYTTVQFGTKYNTTAGVSASQLIFSSDYIFGLKATRAYMSLARVQASSSKSEITANVSKAYYTVIITRDRIKLLESAINRLKRTLDEMKAFHQQGFAEMIDVERIEVQYNNLLTELENANRMTSLSEAALKFHMGVKNSDNVILTDSLKVSTESFQELPATNINLNSRPDFLALRAQQSLLDLDVKRLKWGYLPTVAAYGTYQFNRLGNKFDIFENDLSNPIKQWYKAVIVGATVNLNIFDGLQRHHKIQQAKIAAMKSQYSLANLQLAAEMQSLSAAITYNNAYRSLLNQKRNMQLAEHVYDVAQIKFREGVGSNLEVFTAETSLKESQTNYFISVYDMIVAKIDYEKATGAYNK